MTIFIVGDGGIGSNLAVPLVKMLAFQRAKEEEPKETKIVIIDGDRIEEKNLVRQTFIPEDIGKYKADVTATHLAFLCEDLKQDIEIESLPVYLKEDSVSIIKDGDMVLMGVDNYITRAVVEKHAATLNNIFVVYGGNEYTDGDVNIYCKKNGEEVTPLYSKKHPEILNKDRFPDEIGCEEALVSAPQLILVNGTVATFMLEAVHNFTTDKTIPWHEKIFDVSTGNSRIEV